MTIELPVSMMKYDLFGVEDDACHINGEYLDYGERSEQIRDWVLDDFSNIENCHYCFTLLVTANYEYSADNDSHSRRHRYTPSDKEIESVFEYFRKTGREATRRELRKYLNYQRVHHALREKGLTRLYKYPESIKQSAVRSVLGGRSCKDVAQSLGACVKTIRNWVNDEIEKIG